jgi:hypothetical protein
MHYETRWHLNIKMKRIILAVAVMLALAACGFNSASQPYVPGPDTAAGA